MEIRLGPSNWCFLEFSSALHRFFFEVDLTNVEVAVPVVEVIVTLARSDLPVYQRKHAQKLLDEIQSRYPCLFFTRLFFSKPLTAICLGVFVDKLSNRACVQGVRWRQRDTDELVTTLVAQAVDPCLTDSSGAVRTLTQFVESYPKVMIRRVVVLA